jgi:hypothetical protein
MLPLSLALRSFAAPDDSGVAPSELPLQVLLQQRQQARAAAAGPWAALPAAARRSPAARKFRAAVGELLGGVEPDPVLVDDACRYTYDLLASRPQSPEPPHKLTAALRPRFPAVRRM